MPLRVRDLEIALVLAREMKAAAERSVEASLRLDQLQEVFGVEELDRAERARIQTALQMAGLEPFPSLLEADPSEPISFGASKAAVAAGGAASGPPPPPPPAPHPEAAESQAAFPTVGEFARSKLRPRRFGVRRGDHGEDEAPPPADESPEPDPAPQSELNGHMPDGAEIDLPADEEPVEEEPVAEEPVAEEPVAEEPVAEEEHEEHEPVADYEHDDEPEPDQREYIPLAAPEPVAFEEPEPEPAAAPPASRAEAVAVLLPAVAIPVIVTSIAGWQFGLPFVALSVIAAGWVMSREKRGFFASIRHARAARTVLAVTAVVTALSGVAAIVLASLPDSSSTSKKQATPAKQAQPPVASKPATPPKKPVHKKKPTPTAKHRAATPPPTKTATPPPTTAATPPPDPATQGLIRVPPSSSSSGGGTTTTP
jgi:hypothetical protein